MMFAVSTCMYKEYTIYNTLQEKKITNYYGFMLKDPPILKRCIKVHNKSFCVMYSTFL